MSGDLLQVRIPAGVTPGSSLTVQSADGRLFAVVVPQGLRPGDLLTVDIRDTEGGGSTVVVAEPAVAAGSSAVSRGDDADAASSKTALGAAAVGAVVGTILIGPITGKKFNGILPLQNILHCSVPRRCGGRWRSSVCLYPRGRRGQRGEVHWRHRGARL